MKIVIVSEKSGRLDTLTIPDATNGVNHTTGWLAIETPTIIRWFNKDRIVEYTVSKEDK
jgi:hypothetical protein